jgi:hypothetical protein
MFLARSPKRSAGAVFMEIVLPRKQADRILRRQRLLSDSNLWISDLAQSLDRKISIRNSKRFALRASEHTDDATTAALEKSLLDAVARQNDEMSEILRQLCGR